MTDTGKHHSLGPNKGKVLFVIGDIITFKLTGEETNDAYSVVEIISQPGGGPFFLHTHIPQETFYIIEGDFEIYGQGENGEKYTIPAPPGATVHVPGGVPHGFKNAGSAVGKVLVMYEPAVNMLNFFNEIGVPMNSPSDPLPMDKMPSKERITEVMTNNKMEIIEPLPG